MSKANALTTEQKHQISRIEAYMNDEADTISTKDMAFLKSILRYYHQHGMLSSDQWQAVESVAAGLDKRKPQ